MKLSAFLVVLASTFVSAEVGGILICNGANATGHCDYRIWNTTFGNCNSMPEKLYEKANTFALDGDKGFYCYPRAGKCTDICTSPEGCTIGAVDFNSPYKFDLASVGWGNSIGNFYCYNSTSS